jgi:ribosome-associated translation inhibitor RaiA
MTLKWNLVTKGLRPHEQLRQKLQQKVRKLETHLEHFPPDAVLLQVGLERHPKKVWFTAGLTLRLPSNILRAEKTGPDPVPAFDSAIKALLREIAVLKSALRRESTWRCPSRHQVEPPRVASLYPFKRSVPLMAAAA